MCRILLLLFALIATMPVPAHAGACRDNPTLQPLPASLTLQVRNVFGLSQAPTSWVRKTTVIRCMNGEIWACNQGANLPCGKANTASAMPAGNDWCRQNPSADFIPAYITGHDSRYRWRCANGHPAITGPAAATDLQGYLVQYWKRLT